MVQSYLEILIIHLFRTVTLSEEIPSVQRSTLTSKYSEFNKNIQDQHFIYMPESEKNSSESLSPVIVVELNSSKVC